RHGWHLVPMDENVGFGAGMNQGAARAFELGATDVLLINPDAHIDAESIDALQRSVLVDEPSAASPVVKDPSGRVWSAGVDLYLADGTMRNPRRRPEHVGEDRLFWLSGACMW